jgi:malate dehydrogenase
MAEGRVRGARVPHRKVTVVGAGNVGATVAFSLASRGVADVVLVDVADGLPQGKALDMMHARSVLRFEGAVIGSNRYEETAGSDVVVITAGVPRRPGMTRDELLSINAGIVRSVVAAAVAASPDAVLLCVTNPLDVMTRLAWRLSGMPLDSARFAYFIAQETGAPVSSIDALVVGAHGDSMVPLPRLSTVAGTPLTEVLTADRVAEVVRRTVFGGAEVVALLKTGSAFYAPGVSASAMVEVLLDDTGATMPACVLLEGQYGVSGVYLSVPALLGLGGVRHVPELALTDDELEAVRAGAAGVAESFDALGEG